ncbi:GRB10-interacting GYF protein 2-like [Haliotis asinina]|uniref:GRB10-interacting GYF protein 2-like n=1 Tax=Haliotis asinina TaxID=109174 RepID=UPI0035323769
MTHKEPVYKARVVYACSLLLHVIMTHVQILLVVVMVLPLFSHGNTDWKTLDDKLADLAERPDPVRQPSKMDPTFVQRVGNTISPDAPNADTELMPDGDVVWDVMIKSLLDSGKLVGPGAESFKDELQQIEQEGQQRMELEFVQNPLPSDGETGPLSTEISNANGPEEVIAVRRKRNKRKRKKTTVALQKGDRRRNRELKRQEKQKRRELKRMARLERKRNRQAGIKGKRRKRQKSEGTDMDSNQENNSPNLEGDPNVERQQNRASIPVFQPWKVDNQAPEDLSSEATNVDSSQEDKSPISEGDPNVERQQNRASIPVFQPWKVENQSPENQSPEATNVDSSQEDKSPISEGDPNVERQQNRASIPVFRPWRVENQAPEELNSETRYYNTDGEREAPAGNAARFRRGLKMQQALFSPRQKLTDRMKRGINKIYTTVKSQSGHRIKRDNTSNRKFKLFRHRDSDSGKSERGVHQRD